MSSAETPDSTLPGGSAEQYSPSAAFKWTEQAWQMLQNGTLHARLYDTDDVLSAHIWGPCPRCAHDIDERPTLTAVLTDTTRSIWGEGGGQVVDSPVPVDLRCNCREEHPGVPKGTSGCGVSFRVELPRNTKLS